MLLVQYESLTSPDRMSGELTGLKSFLGIDPALPSSQLPLTNYKHVHTGHGPDAVRAPACLGPARLYIVACRCEKPWLWHRPLTACGHTVAAWLQGMDAAHLTPRCSWGGTGS